MKPSVLDPIIARVNTRFCWIKTTDGPRRLDEPLTTKRIRAHLDNKTAHGACPIRPGESTTRLALYDFDAHDGEVEWDKMRDIVREVMAAARDHGLEPIPFRSSGGQGIHVFFLWDQPQDAYSVRELLRDIIADCLLHPGTGGVAKGQVEIFPKQDSVPPDGYGSMFILPLSRMSTPLIAENDEELLVGHPLRVTPELWKLSADVPQREKPERPQAAPISADLTTLRQALAAIPNNQTDSLDYDAWRNTIFAIHHATDGSDEGLAIAHEFSARSPKYDPDFLDNRVWPYITHDRDSVITARTVFAKAREHGWEEPVEDDFEVLQPEPTDALKPSRFQVLSEDDLLARPRPRWWVKGLVPMAELVVLYGASGSGKSFEAIDLFSAVAQGVPWRGIKTHRGSVVYIAAEGQGGFRNRLEAYCAHHGRKTGLHVIVDAPNLLKADAEPLSKQIVLAGGADILVIDTLAQVSPGGDENSAEDMGRVLSNCRKLHRATGALIVLIHHAGKDLSKGARGWSGLKAAADAELEVNRIEQDRWLKVTKSKDGEDGAEYPFKLLPVVIGQDEDGDEITSCVVEHLEKREAVKREPKGVNNVLVWKLVNSMVDLGGGGVSVEIVVAEAVRNMPENRDGKGKDRRRYLARRAIEQLVKEEFVTVRDDFVYVGSAAQVAENDE